jgi:2-polyprenyl-3-methyl-5-hydroxy-6-metoxy-1,4-benzoquinol methylase
LPNDGRQLMQFALRKLIDWSSQGPRRRTPELMDQPDLDVDEHRYALDSLGRANFVSLTISAIWPSIRDAALRVSGRPVQVLDLACGGGHLATALARRCRRQGIDAQIWGGDLSRVALDHARARAARSGVPDVRFVPLDALADLPQMSFDVVLCSLFLHHLDDNDAVAVLRRMKDATRAFVVVSDLRRTRLGYLLAWVGCRLLSRSRVFHEDTSRSVDAAFTSAEVRQLAERAGLSGAQIINRWPQRFVIVWKRPDVG